MSVPKGSNSTVGRRSTRNGDSKFPEEKWPRLNGYVDPASWGWWEREFRRVKELDGLPRKAGIGELFRMIAKRNLKLDQQSLAETTQDGEPSELSHKPPRRSRVAAHV